MEFRYPETIFVRINDLDQQADHLKSEAEEVVKSLAEGPKRITEELVDSIHSAETMIRILLDRQLITKHDIEVIEYKAVEKNRQRGYYKLQEPEAESKINESTGGAMAPL